MKEELPPNSARRWLFTTDHKDIGILYFVTSLYFLVLGGALALIFRTQLMQPSSSLLLPSSYNQAVTVHGLLMVLWFLSPLAFALANYIVPLQIGTRDLAFPRLNAMSYWLYLFGGLLAALGFFTPGGAIDTGWTVYAPLSTSRFSPSVGVTLGAAGLLLLIASVTLSTVNFLVTVLRMRAEGMTLMRMPLFSWGILLTVFMMLLAFPVLAGAGILLAADRILGTAFFSSNEGGIMLWDNLFWYFGHPEVYIVLMPGLMALGDILPTFARRPLWGKRVLIAAMVAGSTMSLMVWGHHMFTTGVNVAWLEVMVVLTESISIPFGLATLALIATLYRAAIRFEPPMLFALAAIGMFVIGGVTGVFNSSVALDAALRGSYWVVGHFHYTLVGGAVTALIAAVYYWWPKVSGRMFSKRLAVVHFTLYVIGTNLTFFPMLFLLDMPRRIYTYDVLSWAPYNALATAGAYISGAAWLVFFATLLHSWLSGPQAGDNPWAASGLEWMTGSPPPRHDFEGIPIVRPDGSMVVTSLQANGASPQPISRYSPFPLLISLAAFLFLAGALLWLPMALFGIALLAYGLLGYHRERFEVPAIGPGPWPFGSLDKLRLGIWVFLYGEVLLFGSLIGSYLFVRFNSASWPRAVEVMDTTLGSLNTALLFSSCLAAALAVSVARAGKGRALKALLILTFGLGLSFLVNKGIEWSELMHRGFTWTSGLPAAAYFVTTGVHGAHVAAGLIALSFIMSKVFRGLEQRSAIEGFGIYWAFVDIVWTFLFPLFYLM